MAGRHVLWAGMERVTLRPAPWPRGVAPLARGAALALLRRVASTEPNTRVLRALVGESLGADSARALDDEAVRAAVARLIAAGQWHVEVERPYRIATASVRPLEVEDVTAHEAADIVEQLTWIEIELLDMADRPVPGERYWIKTPDGDVIEGRLDRRGRAYVGQLHPGQCEVRFPGLDESAWEPLVPAVPQATPDEIDRDDERLLAARLKAAARTGVPFCAECERRAAARAAAAAGQSAPSP